MGGVYLSESNNKSIYVPERFGHGFLALEDTIVSYKCSNVFYPEGDSGITWNDEGLNIDWPIDSVGGMSEVIVSMKDRDLHSFKEFDDEQS